MGNVICLCLIWFSGVLLLRYYIAYYSAVNQWWQRGTEVFDDFDKAEAVRDKLSLENEQDFWHGTAKTRSNGNKLQVWTVKSWNRLEEGYKHPDNRDDKRLKPKVKRTEQVIIKEFEEVEGKMAAAFKAAGL